MNNQSLKLTSTPALKDGSMFVPWMVRSGGDLQSGFPGIERGQFVRLNAVDPFSTRLELDLSAQDAAELRDALTLHLDNIGHGHQGAPFTVDQIGVWTREGILAVAPNLAMMSADGRNLFVDTASGERFTYGAGEFIKERARGYQDDAAPAGRVELTGQTALDIEAELEAARPVTINLSASGKIPDEDAASIVHDLREDSSSRSYGGWGPAGEFYTAAAVRNLKSKARRHAERSGRPVVFDLNA